MDVNSFVIGYNKGKASAPAGGGVELNIAYGDTPPEDTSMLWVKTSEPRGLRVACNVNLSNHEYTNNRLPIELPLNLCMHRCCAVGNKIYIIGGALNEGPDNVQDSIYVYDTETGEVKKSSATLSDRLFDPSCIVVDKKIYIFGGSNCEKGFVPAQDSYMTRKAYIFDTVTNKMTVLYMPVPCLTNAGIASANGNIYLFGGQYRVYISGKIPNTVTSNYIYKYDGEEFKTVGSLPTTVSSPTCFTWNGNIYVATSASKLVRFDPTDDTVHDDVDVGNNNIMASCLCATVGGFIYGFKQDYFYRERPGDWKRETIENPLLDEAACACDTPIGNKIYIVGGRTKPSNVIRTLDVTIKPPKSVAGIVAIDCAAKTNTEVALSKFANATIKIGVNGVYKSNDDGKFEKISAAVFRDGNWNDI